MSSITTDNEDALKASDEDKADNDAQISPSTNHVPSIFNSDYYSELDLALDPLPTTDTSSSKTSDAITGAEDERLVMTNTAEDADEALASEIAVADVRLPVRESRLPTKESQSPELYKTTTNAEHVHSSTSDAIATPGEQQIPTPHNITMPYKLVIHAMVSKNGKIYHSEELKTLWSSITIYHRDKSSEIARQLNALSGDVHQAYVTMALDACLLLCPKPPYVHYRFAMVNIVHSSERCRLAALSHGWNAARQVREKSYDHRGERIQYHLFIDLWISLVTCMMEIMVRHHPDPLVRDSARKNAERFHLRWNVVREYMEQKVMPLPMHGDDDVGNIATQDVRKSELALAVVAEQRVKKMLEQQSAVGVKEGH